VSFGQSIPFLPTVDQLRKNFAIDDLDGEPERAQRRRAPARIRYPGAEATTHAEPVTAMPASRIHHSENPMRKCLDRSHGFPPASLDERLDGLFPAPRISEYCFAGGRTGTSPGHPGGRIVLGTKIW
jgi:hypothetical protein